MRTGIAIVVYMSALPGAVAQVQLSTVRQPGPGTLAIGTLNVSAAPAIVNFNLVNGALSAGSSSVTINTNWNLLAGTNLNVYGYFADSTAALSGPGGSIPSMRVQGLVPTGVPTSFTPFSQIGPFGAPGGSLRLLSVTLTPISLIGSRSISMNLRISLTGASPLPAGTYTGTLVIQAQAL